MRTMHEELIEATAAPQKKEEKGRFERALEQITESYGLSPREAEMLKYLARGYTKDAIAQQVGVSNNTVRTHSRNVYAKLDVHSRQELMELINRFKQ